MPGGKGPMVHTTKQYAFGAVPTVIFCSGTAQCSFSGDDPAAHQQIKSAPVL